MKQKILAFLKGETVLLVAALLAVVSMFFIPPHPGYMDYIDFRVLGILFCLMLIMAKFQKLGVFSILAYRLLKKTRTSRQLIFVLVYLCFFCAMLITNDVALITFVPFAILTLKQAECEDKILKVVVLQTIAANLGSMLTPIGNPQNLYLYNLAGMSLIEFVLLMTPYTLLSFALLTLVILLIPGEELKSLGIADLRKENETSRKAEEKEHSDDNKNFSAQSLIYLAMFLLSLLAVAHIVPYQAIVVITVICVLLTDREMFIKVDYSLLITFVAFFVFIGNMQQIPAVNQWLQNLVEGRELMTAVLSSQVISNVPAAILLAGFTDKINLLIVGTNLGGLGTLIASMASLISYKFYVKEYPAKKGPYFLYFTIMNLFFIILLLIQTKLLG